jgi:hypothetical protein
LSNVIQRRIPLVALITGLCTALTTYQTTPVYDKVPSKAVLPYISLGAFTCKPNNSKDSDIWDATIIIHIWSSYDGKFEVNEIMNDVSTVLSSAVIDLSADCFNVMQQDIDFGEAWEEDQFGYHGTLTFLAKIQNLGA